MYDHYFLALVRVYLNTLIFFQNESVKVAMAQTFPPGVRNGNACKHGHKITVFDLQA